MPELSCITFWPRQRCINLQVDKWPFWNVLYLDWEKGGFLQLLHTSCILLLRVAADVCTLTYSSPPDLQGSHERKYFNSLLISQEHFSSSEKNMRRQFFLLPPHSTAKLFSLSSPPSLNYFWTFFLLIPLPKMNLVRSEAQPVQENLCGVCSREN